MNLHKKRILIITYYWPPAGGSGVLRWLKFSRYLKEMGWDPIIYTPENPESPIEDSTLLDDITANFEVIKSPIWEPFSIYKFLTGRKKKHKIQTGFLKEKKTWGIIEKLAMWVRANYFIPDAKRYWINPSVKILYSYLRRYPVNVVVSTGPPHSMHLIAKKLKQKTGIPWLADFRDPWTNIDWFDKLPFTKSSFKKHKKLELAVLREADIVTVVSESWALEFEKMSGRKIEVVTNGFAPEDFENFSSKQSDKFTILHTGSLNADRNPVVLWKFLSQEIDKNEFLKEKLIIKLVGAVDIEVFESLRQNKLFNYLVHIPFVPHKQALNEMTECSLLLLPLNNVPNMGGIIPGKLFEYLASKKPILAIGPSDGDTARILKEMSHCLMYDFEETPEWKDIHRVTQLPIGPQLKIDKYSRRELAKRMNELLLSVVK